MKPSLAILGLGTATPPHVVKQAEAPAIYAQAMGWNGSRARALRLLHAQSDIEQRATVLDDWQAGAENQQLFLRPAGDHDAGPGTAARMHAFTHAGPPLAHAASASALSAAGVSPAEITHLITVTCTGFEAPGFDVRLIADLGLSPSVARTHIGFMGCHAALNAMRVANGFCAAEPGARVLICALEICSIHFQYGWESQTLVSNSIFADGAAACVCAAPRENNARLIASTSWIVPDYEDAIGWSIGDNGFRMRLKPTVPDAIATRLPALLDAWLASQGQSLDAIRHWAVHPGGPRILDSIAASLTLPDGALWASREVLAQYGNMSSPTILFILDRLIRSGAKGLCLSLGFGPGLAIEAALLEL